MSTKRKNQKSIKQFNEIINLYWEKAYEQADIGKIFNCDQSYVSKIINNKARSYHFLLHNKLVKLKQNIIPSIFEPKQAKTLRLKREKLHSTKLTWKDVVNIRNSYFLAKLNQVELAKKYKINQSGISKIINGVIWKK